MDADQIKAHLRAQVESLAESAEGEARQLAIVAENLVEQYVAAGGGQEMLNTAENVLAHKVAQAAVRTSREVQDKITGAALFAIRLLVGAV